MFTRFSFSLLIYAKIRLDPVTEGRYWEKSTNVVREVERAAVRFSVRPRGRSRRRRTPSRFLDWQEGSYSGKAEDEDIHRCVESK